MLGVRELNRFEKSALKMFEKDGCLTATMLINRNSNGCEFGSHHLSALRLLVRNRRFSVSEVLAAIDMIDCLTEEQKKGL